MTAESVVNEIADENNREEQEFLAGAKAEAAALRQHAASQQHTTQEA